MSQLLPRPSEIVALFAQRHEASLLYTASMLEAEFRKKYESATRADLREFLREFTTELLTAVNLDFLQNIIAQVHAKHLATPELELQKFGLSTDLPNSIELQNALRDLYTEVSRLAVAKEECQHYSVLLKTLQDTLHSAARAVYTFVTDEDLHDGFFATYGERKRWAETQTADIEAAKQRATALRQVLTTVTDDILAPRNQLLMRTDSALRLVVKSDEIDRGFNRGASANDTEPRGQAHDPFRPQGGYGDPDVDPL